MLSIQPYIIHNRQIYTITSENIKSLEFDVIIQLTFLWFLKWMQTKFRTLDLKHSTVAAAAVAIAVAADIAVAAAIIFSDCVGT